MFHSEFPTTFAALGVILLGIAVLVTQQIIAEHGGRIQCESQPGEGTTFVIELPQQ